MLEAPPVVREQLGVIAQQFVGTQQELGKIDKAAALADVFVGRIQRNHLPPVRVTPVVNVLWPEPFVFLGVDKPLDLLWCPAAVIDLKILEQALE